MRIRDWIIGIIISSSLRFSEAHWDLATWYGYIDVSETKYFGPTQSPLDSYTVLDTSNWLLYGSNDVLFRWNANASSAIRTTILVDENEFAAERIILVLRGVDTFAQISLDNHELGKTSNMHLRYIYDIKDYITFPKQTGLWIKFTSPVKVAEELYNNHSKSYPVYPKCVPSSYNGECHANHVRKMQASFGWDWGPAFPGSGLWYTPDFIAFNSTKLFDVTTDVELIEKTWRITVTAHVENAPNNETKPLTGALFAQLIISLDNHSKPKDFVFNTTLFTINNGEKTTFLKLTLNVPEERVNRWWPNDYGAQTLYVLNITLTNSDHIDWKQKNIGFRTIELVQDPLKNGLSFYFKVNDVPIFAKGSNFIPMNLFTKPLTPKIYTNAGIREKLLQAVNEARMNMIRVWGGGVYESDEFYDLADEYGIMIWQDFMFACSMYPTTPDFLDSVGEEVRQQVWRLKSHPSVVIWAGNNENEAALYGNWYGTGTEQVYKDDYVKLYVDVVKRQCEEMDKTRPFVVSSPSNGKFADDNGWIGTNPYSDLHGDIHYYNYLADALDSNTFKTPRFASEYGVQSFPWIDTLRPYCKNPEVDLVRGSEFLKHRQHLPGGDGFMQLLISKHFRIPETENARQDFECFVYLSQLHQALAVKAQTEHYRRAKSRVNDAGEGMTMGALYWQLNDVWAAPTWSSIDVEGRWKMLHHYAEEFFDPVIVSHKVEGDELKVSVVSDRLVEVTGCFLQIGVYTVYNDSASWRRPYYKKVENITVPVNSVLELPPMSMETLMKDAGCGSLAEAKKKCIIELILFNSKYEKQAPIDYVYPGSLKDLELPACDIYVNIISSFYPIPDRLRKFYGYAYEVTVTSTCTQLFVSIDASGFFEGRFTENGFHILEREKVIGFIVNNKPHSKNLRITSLGNIYSSKPIIQIFLPNFN